MANETIGHVACAHCGEQADVRRYIKGARLLYYNCTECGIIRPSKGSGQAWIQSHVTWLATGSDEGAPVDHDAPARKVQDAPKPPDHKPTKRRGIFGGIDL